MAYNFSEQINTPDTRTLQSVLMQQRSGRLTRALTRNIDQEDQFDSGLWELDGPMHRVDGILFQTGL